MTAPSTKQTPSRKPSAVKTSILGALVKAGQLGKKSGAGFRKYGAGKSSRAVPNPEFVKIFEAHRTGDRIPSEDEITDRLFLPIPKQPGDNGPILRIYKAVD